MLTNRKKSFTNEIQNIKRGHFSFDDKSMPRISVLELYSNLEPEATEYWAYIIPII